MTPQEVRKAISDAANTVVGINCTPNFRQSTKPGDAMVRLDHIDYPNHLAGVTTWQIAVILPQDYATAEEFIDTTVPALRTALAVEMVVIRVTPAQLALDTGTVPVVFIEGQRESE
jgi:hypothetical protein